MKINKAIISMIILILAPLSACNAKEDISSETNYFIPTIETKFESIEKAEFEKAFYKEIKRDFEYSYVGFDISFSKPYKLSENTKISKLYYVGKINKDFFVNENNEGSQWIKIEEMYTENLDKPTNSSIFATAAINNCYNLNKASHFTSSPYSYEYLTKNVNWKYVYSDSLLVESISYLLNDIEVTIKTKYFNEEDLVNNKGEINRNSFIDMAFVSCFKETKIENIDVNIIGKNVLIDRKDESDIGDDSYGDVIINAKIKINKIVENAQVKAYYRWVLEDYKIEDGNITGECVDSLLNTYASDYSYKYSYNLAGYFVPGWYMNEEEVQISYNNNPLSVSISSLNKSDYFEFSDEGIITKRKYENKKTKEIVEVTYHHS